MSNETIKSQAVHPCDGEYDSEMGWNMYEECGWTGRISDLEKCESEYNFLNTDGGAFTDNEQTVRMKVRLLAVELETNVGHISQSMLDELAAKILKEDTMFEIKTVYSEDASALTGQRTCVSLLEDITYALEGLEVRPGVFINQAGFDWLSVREVEPAVV